MLHTKESEKDYVLGRMDQYHAIACQYCGISLQRKAGLRHATCFDCKVKAAKKRGADKVLYKKLVRLFAKRQKIYLHRLPPALRDSLPKGIQRVLSDFKF